MQSVCNWPLLSDVLNVCLHLIWPGGQTSRCRCGVAHALRFEDGTVQQDHVDEVVSEVVVGIGLEVTVKEKQRRVRHEKGEGEMERSKTQVQTPVS